MLPDGMRMLITTLSQILGSVILIAVIQPIFLVAAVVVFFLIYKAAGQPVFRRAIQGRRADSGYVPAYLRLALYRMSARELRRNQNVLRSSVFSTFGESLTGLSTIRAYGRIRSVLALNYRQVDHEKCVPPPTFPSSLEDVRLTQPSLAAGRTICEQRWPLGAIDKPLKWL
jgi:ABC-type multidrug transport system fused ATPase/permease subunit